MKTYRKGKNVYFEYETLEGNLIRFSLYEWLKEMAQIDYYKFETKE